MKNTMRGLDEADGRNDGIIHRDAALRYTAREAINPAHNNNPGYQRGMQYLYQMFAGSDRQEYPRMTNEQIENQIDSLMGITAPRPLQQGLQVVRNLEQGIMRNGARAVGDVPNSASQRDLGELPVIRDIISVVDNVTGRNRH